MIFGPSLTSQFAANGINPNLGALISAQPDPNADLAAIVSVTAPTTASGGIMGFLSKKVVGPVTVGELAIGGAALAVVGKLMKVW